MDANRETVQLVEVRCYLCDHELIAQVRSHEGGLDFTMVCPLHGSRGTNEIFRGAPVAARS